MAPKTTGDQVANTTRNTSESREHAGEPCLHATGRRFRLSAGTQCWPDGALDIGGPSPRPYDFFPEALHVHMYR